jgi:Flp pilus assembly protein TadD
LRLQNVYPDAHHDLGIVYLQNKMMNEAMEEFRTTLAQQPGNAPATLNLALAYQMKGDPQTARQTLDSWLQQYGSSNSPYLGQVRARLAQLR